MNGGVSVQSKLFLFSLLASEISKDWLSKQERKQESEIQNVHQRTRAPANIYHDRHPRKGQKEIGQLDRVIMMNLGIQ